MSDLFVLIEEPENWQFIIGIAIGPEGIPAIHVREQYVATIKNALEEIKGNPVVYLLLKGYIAQAREVFGVQS